MHVHHERRVIVAAGRHRAVGMAHEPEPAERFQFGQDARQNHRAVAVRRDGAFAGRKAFDSVLMKQGADLGGVNLIDLGARKADASAVISSRLNERAAVELPGKV